MRESSRLATLLFWFMLLAGGAILAPCLILPAWLEYRAALDLKALLEQQVARREAEVVKLRKQREHLATDEAYVLRLAHEHFNIELPGVQRIPVEPSPLSPPGGADQPDALMPATEDELLPELSAMVDQVLERHPLAGMFVWPQTRPSLLLIGGGLILMAVLLLGPAATARPR